jgi:ADP-ribosyl-[dinitrogen reductase] hydrolase
MRSDSIVRTVVGGALGDGWGRPHKGSVRRIPARVPDELVVTDDTQLTVATCEAIADAGPIDPGRIASPFQIADSCGRLHGEGVKELSA